MSMLYDKLYYLLFILLVGRGIQCNEENESSPKFEAANTYFEDGEYESAFEVLRDCASFHPGCQYLLGVYLILGLSPLKARQQVEGLLLWKLASDGGWADSQYALGIAYELLPEAVTFYSPRNDNLFIMQEKDSSSLKFPLNSEIRLEIVLEDGRVKIGGSFPPYIIENRKKNSKTLEKTGSEYSPKTAVALLYTYSAAIGSQHVGARLALASKFTDGAGVLQNCNAAAKYYLPLASPVAQTHSNSLPPISDMIKLKPTISEEEALLSEGAETGDVRMQTLLGKRYLLGSYGFQQDYVKARKFFSLASESGEALACLGYIYALGLGVDRDLEKAAEYFFEAAFTHEEPLGLNGIGYVYFYGTTKYPQNWPKALSFFLASAKMNLPDAAFNVGAMYFSGAGTQVNHVEALKWFTKALEDGHTPAAYVLGIIQLNGLGTIRDCWLAVRLLKRASEKHEWVRGILKAAREALERDQAEVAAFLLAQAADAGVLPAQLRLAEILITGKAGLFVEPNSTLAIMAGQKWLEMAAAQDDLTAREALGNLAYSGKGVESVLVRSRGFSPAKAQSVVDSTGRELGDVFAEVTHTLRPRSQDFKAAFLHYQLASTMKSLTPEHEISKTKALYSMGYMYHYGLGVPQDFFMGRKNYNRALTSASHDGNLAIHFSLFLLKVREAYTRGISYRVTRKVLEDGRIRTGGALLLFLVFLVVFRFSISRIIIS